MSHFYPPTGLRPHQAQIQTSFVWLQVQVDSAILLELWLALVRL